MGNATQGPALPSLAGRAPPPAPESRTMTVRWQICEACKGEKIIKKLPPHIWAMANRCVPLPKVVKLEVEKCPHCNGHGGTFG